MDDLTASPPSGQPGPTDADPAGSEPLATVAPATDPPATDPLATFRRWAMTLFTLLVVLIAVGTVVVVAGTHDVPAWELVVAVTGLALAVVALSTLLVGLDRRRGWAIPTAIATCWVLVAAAVIRVVVDLQRGAITIPLEGIAAAAVLTRLPAHRPAVAPRDRRLAIVLTLVFVASEAWPLVTGAGGVGRLLGAPAEALTLTTETACSDLRDVTGDGRVDRVLATTVTWTWSQGELLAGGEDGMLVHWAGDGESSGGTTWEPVLIEDDLDTHGPAIWRGTSSPSASLLQDPTIGLALEVTIDVGARGLADGSVGATVIAGSDPPPAHGSVQVWAEYAHLDRWKVTSDPVTCSW